MYYNKTITLWFKSNLLLFFIFASIIFITDPYHFFHKPWVHKNKINVNFRIQNYGLLRFEKFDSVIIGTSMLENTSSAEASQKLGGHFINISFPAATYYERFMMLNPVLKKRKIKRLITSLDFKFNRTKSTENTFIDLYKHDAFYYKFQTYLNTKDLLCIFNKNKCNYIKNNMDRPHAWFQGPFHAKRFGGFENWLKCKNNNWQIQDALKTLKTQYTIKNVNSTAYKEIIDQEILPLFEHKDTQFELIIPPYSVLWWAKAKNFLNEALRPYEYLIEQTEKYPNVNIYWFYDQDFVFDVATYKDLTHYHHTINSKQLDAIKNKSHIISINNYKEKIANFKQKILAFDLDYYLKLIE